MPAVQLIRRLLRWKVFRNEAPSSACTITEAQAADDITMVTLPGKLSLEQRRTSYQSTYSKSSFQGSESDVRSEISDDTIVSPPPSRPSTIYLNEKRQKTLLHAIQSYLVLRKRVHRQIREIFHQIHVLSEKVEEISVEIQECDGGGYKPSEDPDAVARFRAICYSRKKDLLQRISDYFLRAQQLQMEISHSENRLRQWDDGTLESSMVREFLSTL